MNIPQPRWCRWVIVLGVLVAVGRSGVAAVWAQHGDHTIGFDTPSSPD